MLLIKTLADIEALTAGKAISAALAEHFQGKLNRLQASLEPDTSIKVFSLQPYSMFVVLQAGDNSLAEVGLLRPLSELMPEWVSRVLLDDGYYYILYIMVDNDRIIQIYIPNGLIGQAMRQWLDAQPVENEARGADDDGRYAEPF